MSEFVEKPAQTLATARRVDRQAGFVVLSTQALNCVPMTERKLPLKPAINAK